MLKPSMNELMAKVNNRYLLVNLAAQRARDLSDESETTGEKLSDKAVKLALDEIADGTIIYCDGPRVEPEPQPEPEAAPELAGEAAPVTLDLDDEEEGGEEDGGEAGGQPLGEFAFAVESPLTEGF